MDDLIFDPNDLLVETTKLNNTTSSPNLTENQQCQEKYEQTNDLSDTLGTPQVIQVENQQPQSAIYNPLTSPTIKHMTPAQNGSQSEDDQLQLDTSNLQQQSDNQNYEDLTSPTQQYIVTAINQTELQQKDTPSEKSQKQSSDDKINLNLNDTPFDKDNKNYKSMTSNELDSMLNDMESKISEAHQDMKDVNQLTKEISQTRSGETPTEIPINFDQLTDSKFHITNDLILESRKLHIDLEAPQTVIQIDNYAMQNEDFSEFANLEIKQPVINQQITDFNDNFSDDDEFVIESIKMQSNIVEEKDSNFVSISEIQQVKRGESQDNLLKRSSADDYEASTSFATKEENVDSQCLQKYIFSPEKEAHEPTVSSQTKIKIKFRWSGNFNFDQKVIFRIKCK